MSHLTGWQGERKGVRTQSARQKQRPQPSEQGLFLNCSPSKTHPGRSTADERLPSNFPWHVSRPAARCTMVQWVSQILLPDREVFLVSSANLGNQVLPVFPRRKKEAPNQGSTQQTQSEHKGIVLSPVCELWKSFFHGKFWILIVCVGSGRKQAFSPERRPPVLLIRKTLHLWLDTTPNHEEMEDGRLFGYVSLYPCPTFYLSLHLPWKLRAVNKPSTTEKCSALSELSSKLKMPQAWVS